MTEKIGIVVDSTADFPSGMVKELGLYVVPIHIVIDGTDYLHGAAIGNDSLIAAMREDREVPTSPPIPSEYTDFLEKLLERYDRLLSFHVSQELSHCYTSVKGAVQLMFDDAADRAIPIDTRTCTAGQALIVKRAAEMLQWGFALEEVLYELDFLSLTAACILPSIISIG